MKEGQIISIPLDDGRFVCARVLQFDMRGENRDSRMCIIGLLNWIGNVEPSSESISGSKLIDHGQVHIKTIRESGGEIVGFRSLDLDEISVPLTLDQSPGKNCRLRRGFIILGNATEQQQTELKVFRTWGYGMLKIKAEKCFSE